MTPESLMSKVTGNLAKVKSVSNSLNMDVELEDVLQTTEIAMDMKTENTTKPMAGHAKGSAHVNLSGTEVGSDIEIYQIKEGQEFVTYSSMYGKWSRETSNHSKNTALNKGLFQESGKTLKSFRIAKEPIQLEKKECYEMYGDITGKELLQFMGLDMVGAFGLVNLPGTDTIANMKIPITIDIYKEKLLPARIMIDMTDVMNDLYDQNGKTTNINNFMIKLEYTGFNQTQKIEVPADIKAAAKAA